MKKNEDNLWAKLSDEKELDKMSERELNKARKVLEKKAGGNDPRALEALGYACYGGSRLYSCNWERSRDCFLELMEHPGVDDTQRSFYANTLGYIYYYGRTNNGEPQYEEAFKYFSIGAAGGIYESLYKLSDMFANGYGVPRNSTAAKRLLTGIYHENLSYICEGKFNCKFADVALRIGSACMREGKVEQAYYYYTLAEFAILKRLKYNSYGDSVVFANIEKALTELREKYPARPGKNISLRYSRVLLDIFEGNWPCRVTLRKKDRKLIIKIKRKSRSVVAEPKRFFICLPLQGYCDLASSITLETKDADDFTWTDDVILSGKKKSKRGKDYIWNFIADGVELSYEKSVGCHIFFTVFGKRAAHLAAGDLLMNLPGHGAGKFKNCEFAGVTFSPEGKEYDYLTGGIGLLPGDLAVVSVNGEEKVVQVKRVFSMSVPRMPKGAEWYKQIVRKA